MLEYLHKASKVDQQKTKPHPMIALNDVQLPTLQNASDSASAETPSPAP